MNNHKNLDRDAFEVIRGKLWWSKDDVARVFNVSRKTVEAWESGARSPGGPALKLLAVAARHPEVLLEA